MLRVGIHAVGQNGDSLLKSGIIHADLAYRLAGLRHLETFVICDAGLPLGALPCIDLGYRYGSPSFADVVQTVLPAVVVQDSWISTEMIAANPAAFAVLTGQGLRPNRIDHEVFKKRVLNARFAIRTGEATPYANVLCQAGVPFG
jgi:D-ribose pyranase